MHGSGWPSSGRIPRWVVTPRWFHSGVAQRPEARLHRLAGRDLPALVTPEPVLAPAQTLVPAVLLTPAEQGGRALAAVAPQQNRGSGGHRRAKTAFRQGVCSAKPIPPLLCFPFQATGIARSPPRSAPRRHANPSLILLCSRSSTRGLPRQPASKAISGIKPPSAARGSIHGCWSQRGRERQRDAASCVRRGSPESRSDVFTRRPARQTRRPVHSSLDRRCV
jgi:hypothetical protein